MENRHDHDIRDLLADQNGALSRHQALECLSPSALERRVARGDLARPLPRVLQSTDRTHHDRERIRLAGLWAGDTGTVIGAAGAVWWRLHHEVPARIGVMRPPGSSNRAPSGVAVRRGVIAPEDQMRVDGIMLTKRPRTVLDAAVDLGLLDGARLMDRALQQDSVTLDGLHAALERRAGAWGTPRARALVELADGGARSQAERRTIRSLRRGGVRGFEVNHEITVPGWGVAVLDLAFREARVAVEIDGWAYHRDVDRFRHDARRQNALVVAGWIVLRVTWYDLCLDEDAVVTLVRAALDAARRTGPRT